MRGPTNLLKTFMVLIVDRTIDLEKPVVKKRAWLLEVCAAVQRCQSQALKKNIGSIYVKVR